MRNQHSQPLNSISDDDIVINYAIHTHPMTQLKTPDLLDEEKDSLFQITCQILYAALPLILCFQLNILPMIMNLYLIGNHDNPVLMAAVGLGTVLANIFGYLIIQNMAVGFSIVCSYFEDKEQIGYMYQKTLGINFFLCILITPILYLSDKILINLGFNHELVQYSTEYAWALVPSFYLYSFYDTTRNYLQSQKVIYPPLIVGTIGTILHYCVAKYFIYTLGFGVTGAAWAKNISDAFNCLVIYLYIIKEEPTKQSWIEWNICATNNVHKFLIEILTHEVFTYFESLALQLLCILACHLASPPYIASNFAFSSTYIIYFYVVMGVAHCLNRTLSLSIEDNNVKIGKKKAFLGIFFVISFTVILVLNLKSDKEIYSKFFNSDPQTVSHVQQTLPIFVIVVIVAGLQTILQGIMKTLQVENFWKIIVFCLYVLGLGFALVLGFYFDLKLTGLWGGWGIGLTVLLCYEIRYLMKIEWEEDFDKVREKYKVIQENIRESRIQMATRQF